MGHKLQQLLNHSHLIGQTHHTVIKVAQDHLKFREAKELGLTTIQRHQTLHS